MSNGTKKKFILPLLCLLALSLIGAKKAPITLELGSGTRLIDLDKAIERAEWGTGGEDGEDPSEGPAAEDGEDPDAGGSPVVKPYEIRIEGKQITMGTATYTADRLSNYIDHDMKSMNAAGVTLIDKYADSKVYKQVMQLLEDKGISYSEKQE
ncbi:MAG: hypothetical protein K5891_09655 [Lachnospiraceae bacterium]|nr:hypothetical protein [Lachnospiraceae bacterium]